MARKEWWERSLDLFFRKKRDPGKLRKNIKKEAMKQQTNANEFRKKFAEDVEKIRKRMSTPRRRL